MVMPPLDAVHLRDVLQECGWCRRPAPETGVGDGDALHAPSHPDIGETAFFVVVIRYFALAEEW
jgi:hypothetical protein